VTDKHPTLAGHLLIAMPGLADPNFWQSVVLLGVHSHEEGAFGLVINRMLEVNLREVLIEIGEEPIDGELPEVLAGGPVQPSHGFVLFERDDREAPNEEDITISDTISVSGSTETLARLARGSIGGRYVLLLGYSGWHPLRRPTSKGVLRRRLSKETVAGSFRARRHDVSRKRIQEESPAGRLGYEINWEGRFRLYGGIKTMGY
jgi:putative transcriptional regulator